MWTYNIKETYVDEYDPWLVISESAYCTILSTTNGLKGYSSGKLLFGRDMIIPIEHKVGWELILQ